MITKETPGLWQCACVRRRPNGQIRAIKMNSPQIKRCPVCKAEKPKKKEAADVR